MNDVSLREPFLNGEGKTSLAQVDGENWEVPVSQSSKPSFDSSKVAWALPAVSGTTSNAVFPLRFGRIESRVRAAHERFRIPSIPRQRGHPDTDGQGRAVRSFADPRLGGIGADLLGGDDRAGSERGGQDYRELFTPITTHDIDGSHATNEPLCKIPQGIVSCHVTEVVVEPFEVVDVDHQKGERSAVPASAFRLPRDAVSEIAIVVKLRQLVASGELFRFLQKLDLDHGRVPELVSSL